MPALAKFVYSAGFFRLFALVLVVVSMLPHRALSRTPTASSTDFPVASDVRLAGDQTRTRLILEVSRSIQLNAFLLADPYRVVLDLPQISFRLPAKAGESGRGLIKAFRYGLVMPGGSRLVLDATGPVRIDKAFVLEPVDDQPARLVLDLVATDRDSFMRELALTSKGSPGETAKVAHHGPAAPSDSRPVIVLDPGHGGMDAGTSAPNGMSEKTLVLDFANELRERLDKTGRYRVIMTRSDDRFVPLGDRVRLARTNKAALFVSIHADALAKDDGGTRGATIYTLADMASDAEAARLADAENRADIIAGVDLSAEPDDVADILIDLTHRETKTLSAQFARGLANELKTAAKLHKQPLRSAGFRVLKAPDVPSVLVELGYVSSPQDLKLMTSDAWRRRAAESVVQAVTSFFAGRAATANVGLRTN
jgi:N-acetylmuramoyl-L-alanine amidase